ncbi:MAG: IS110 family transposase [Actinomycetota bacterium]|nr:IS110 family transposase [Actinomycetota bacterium]
MRFIGLDVHRDFCEVAIAEDGELRSAGRIETSPEALELFARSLGREDEVALEATGVAAEIARVIGPHVARVVVAKGQDLPRHDGRAKTDRLDARSLARLLAQGYLSGVWVPDEQTRALRRRLGRRAGLVRQRTRQKNEVHGVLMRNLKGRPPVSDVFGRAGRAWLSGLELAPDEAETLAGALRQIDFLSEEVARIEAELARAALARADIRRLMTIPGVDLVTAASVVAAIGDVERFATPRQLVGYLGLDPRVRQSGEGPARHGRISKQGSSQARHALGEAAWVALRTPGPLSAFGERIRARRGAQVAATAVARKLAVLCWHLLARGEDYAFARPSLTRQKLRRLELLSGARPRRRRPARAAVKRSEERELAVGAEAAYRRLANDWQRTGRKLGAGATPGRASSWPSERQAARQGLAPDPAL